MGCSISPPVAIIHVNILEKHSIFTDLHITTGIWQYYKRYVDDMCSLARGYSTVTVLENMLIKCIFGVIIRHHPSLAVSAALSAFYPNFHRTTPF